MAVGDHLQVRRRYGPVTFFHHGIEVEGGCVVHFEGPIKKPESAYVKRTTKKVFSRGSSIEVIEYRSTRYSPKQIALRANRRADAAWGLGDYDLESLNCEHFAYWCISGLYRSSQVATYRKVRRALVTGARAAVNVLKPRPPMRPIPPIDNPLDAVEAAAAYAREKLEEAWESTFGS